MSKNTEFLGFNSMFDFLNSLLGLKSVLVNGTVAILATITSFITGYVWDSPSAIYALWVIMFADWFTGVFKAMKNKNFTSARLFRMPIYFVATSAVISFSWWMAKSSIFFIPLPSLVYGGFIAVYFTSLLENLGDLELLPKGLVTALKTRFGLKSIVDKYTKTEETK